jgi:hypothetical protein
MSIPKEKYANKEKESIKRQEHRGDLTAISMYI